MTTTSHRPYRMGHPCHSMCLFEFFHNSLFHYMPSQIVSTEMVLGYNQGWPNKWWFQFFLGKRWQVIIMARNWNGHTADIGKILSAVENSDLRFRNECIFYNKLYVLTFQANMQTAFCFLLMLGCTLGRQGQKCCSSCKSIVGKETLLAGMPPDHWPLMSGRILQCDNTFCYKPFSLRNGVGRKYSK